MDVASRRDDGFTLVEVIFAAFIAFFVLTALFSMVAVSNKVDAASRQDVKATALANMIIEEARSLPYEAVGVVGGNPAGLLVSEETTTYSGKTYTVERRVTWVDDSSNGTSGAQDYKQFTVVVRWGPHAAISFTTYIRDKVEDSFPPTVTWVRRPDPDVVIFNPTGTHAAVVWDKNGGPWASIGSAVVQASAEATGSSGLITRLELWTERNLLPGAAWQPNAVSFTCPAYTIDSLATDASGTAYLPDGPHMVKAEAWTASGLRDYAVWSFVVDNDPPSWGTAPDVTLAQPAASANIDRYNSRLVMNWTAATDNGGNVSAYNLRLAGNGSSTFGTYAFTGSSPFTLGTALPTGLTTAPFTAYKVFLEAKSARGLTTASSQSAWTCTNPQLTGTIRNDSTRVVTNPQYVVTLNVSQPSAATLTAMGATSVKYNVAEASSWTGSDMNTKKTGFSNMGSGVISINNPGTGMYYQVSVDLYNGTQKVGSVFTNVIGPSGAPGPRQSMDVTPTVLP